MCVGREVELHTCATARLAGPGVAWRNMRAHDIRVNGPPKSSLSPCAVLLPFAVFVFCYLAFVFGYLAFKSIYGSNRFPKFLESDHDARSWVFYISEPSASIKIRSNRVRILPLLAAAPPS